ncbi:Uncharacterized protein RNJ44_02551 [Nakaseomyces bracarensis]|uniref:Potassium channel tetramerisation-type BTB domain-containing protein n=1 Tax=Nakaseomyces bracarensis TaxID=273131 RepID=A0ABR4NM08_9SACH
MIIYQQNNNIKNNITEMEDDYEKIPDLLPRDQVYKVQVGQKLYNITGATLSWDGPNFFTNYFKEHDDDSILFLDRSTESFETIYRHMQGYFIAVRDEVEYTTVYTDALYYSLPKLVRFLKNSDFYYINVGGESFAVAKSLFKNKGDSNNYFQVVIAGFYRELEKRILDRRMTTSPNPPTYVPRSPEFFRQLLTLLSGVKIDLDDRMRNSLIQECRYYRFKGLEQELVKHRTLVNPLSNVEEISIHLDDIVKSGLGLRKPASMCSMSLVSACLQQEEQHRSERCMKKMENGNNCTESGTATTDNNVNGNDTVTSRSPSPINDNNDDKEADEPERKRIKLSDNKKCNHKNEKIWDIVTYQRPYVDAYPRDLIFQLDANECMLIFNKSKKTIHVDLGFNSAVLFESLFSYLFSNDKDVSINLEDFKLNPSGGKTTTCNKSEVHSTSPHLVLPACVSLCDLQVNGIKCNNIFSLVGDTKCNEKVPDFTDMENIRYCVGLKLHIAKSMWKIGVKNNKIMLIAIKAVTYCSTKEYCKTIDFL